MTRHPGFFLASVLLLVGGGVAAYFEMGVLATFTLFGGVVSLLSLVSSDMWEHHNQEIDNRTGLVQARTKFAAGISVTDDETRQFLAQEWPELGVEFGEESLAYLLKDGVNTGILLSFLRAFLMDSTEQSFVELRNYNDDKTLQERFNVSREIVRRQWRLATEFFEGEGYLLSGSMAGNQTYKFTTAEHFKKLRRRYLNVTGLPRLA